MLDQKKNGSNHAVSQLASELYRSDSDLKWDLCDHLIKTSARVVKPTGSLLSSALKDAICLRSMHRQVVSLKISDWFYKDEMICQRRAKLSSGYLPLWEESLTNINCHMK